MTPWEHDGLVGALEAGFSSFRYRTWPQAYDECDMPEDLKATMPMWEDGLAVWKMLREWHAAYIDLYYDTELHVLADPEIQQYWTFRTTPQYTRGLPPLSKEALIDQVTHSVFWACAFHEFVGGAVEYVTDPGGLFLQVRPGQTMADMQHMVQAQSLTAATGSPMPKLSGDWSYLLDLGHSAGTNKLFERVRVLHGGLARRMREVSAEIAERNTRRPQSFSAFDPLTFECSVSL
ncbi:unnamed protein product [Prorocentrum cordatum]|uniref:Lipoxygenase domain-containing protein n=1 Tax=Prorocentrum cordatum TaxID=2364126 RepID=A0ABN9WZN2_9DINO|nr:unnamed protein product [Polarella glacialis]